MKDKTDRELLIETHRDVSWMRENQEKMDTRLLKVESDAHKLSNKVNYGFGVMAAIAVIWEKFWNK